MRRIENPRLSIADLVPVGEPVTVARDSKNLTGRLVVQDRLQDQGLCLACSDAPCLTRRVGNRAIDICPVNAITKNSSGRIEISDQCVGCGLCSITCPVGAIEFKGTGLVQAPKGAFPEELAEKVDSQSHQKWLRDLQLTSNMSHKEADKVAKQITTNLKSEKAAVVYPVVATLLSLVGMPASASNMGDTSSRADVTIFWRGTTLPVEVKSFTEVEVINLKAVQQALENKLFASRQDQALKLSPHSSLVVGFGYPSDRTQIIELVEDIESAFNIRIGLISIEKLIQLVILKHFGDGGFDGEQIANLKGVL